MGFFHSTTSQLATVSLLLALCVPVTCQASALTASVTHECSLTLTPSKGFKLTCQRQRAAPASCNLVVYYYTNGTVGGNNLPIEPNFGVPGKRLPPRPAWALVKDDKTEQMLNRTEPLWKATIWPMLYFHGSNSCTVLVTPQILGVRLPDNDSDSTAVLAFGGGLTATLSGGDISDTQAGSTVIVLANSTLTVQGTKFARNKVRKGAVYGMWSSRLLVQQATFVGNTGEGEGGGMYLVGSNCTLRNSTLDSNVAANAGGAIYVKFSSLDVGSTKFLNNTAPVGGAVTVYSNSNVTFTNSSLLSNTARPVKAEALQDQLSKGSYYMLGVGGALYVEQSSVNITLSKVLGNRAVMDGGAVRMYLGQLNIASSNVDHNRAHRHGGAIFFGTEAQDRSVLGHANLTVYNTTLDNNEAEANGGAIMLQRRAHTSIINSTINNSHAWSEGGGVCTAMPGARKEDQDKADDLQTMLEVKHVFFNGTSADDKLFVGPHFRLIIHGTNVTKGFPTDYNRTSPGIVHRRRLCDRGEYVAATNYCEECPSYQFSTVVAPNGWAGHEERNCTPADNAAHAPGGAVLVPISGAWHGINESLKNCTGCPRLYATFGDIRKCCNPAACRHDPKELAELHPNSQKQNKLKWEEYGRQLCDHREGYEGILCGECIRPGFGMTAPFKCNRCIGSTANSTYLPGGSVAAGRPSGAGISMMYLAYWVALTCWMLLTVRFSMLLPGRKQQLDAKALKATADAEAAVRPPEEEAPPVEKAWGSEEGGLQDTSPNHQYDQQPAFAAAPGRTGTGEIAHPVGSTPKERSKSLDITKTLIVYTQWAMLIINLPVSWLPWATAASGSTAEAPSLSAQSFTTSVENFVGFFFGRSASIDCFLQAWNLLQQNEVQAIVRNTFTRAVGSVIVVPVVLFVSVLLLQLLFSALRRPFLRVVDRLCANSEFFRRYLAGVLMVPSSTSSLQSTANASVPDEECPDVGRAFKSTSTAGSRGSFLSGSVFGDEVTPGSRWNLFKDNVVATALASSMFVYLTIARVALGMLLCVKVGSSQRWILDVRLQCPTSQPMTGWGGGAVFFGVLLLCVCLAWPVSIAWVLIQEAHKGKLMRVDSTCATAIGPAGDPTDAGDADSAAHSTARLAIRYADYAVDFDSLKVSPGADSGGVALPRPSFGSDAWMARLRMYTILTWDSILDLHRLTVALASVCVMLQEIHQLILMVLALGSYLLLVLLVKPWRAKAVWRLQVLALAILIASCLGIMACTVSNADTYYSSVVYAKAIPWLVLLANLFYLVLLVVLLVRCVLREVPRLADVKAYLVKRWRRLRLKQQRVGRRGSY